LLNTTRLNKLYHDRRKKRKRTKDLDPESLEYISRRLKKYFKQQKKRNVDRSQKELSMSALKILETMLFPKF